jgi:ATP-dependent RNA helicase DeaD
LTQNERTTALQSLRDGRSRVCVATDVAARGIDLPNLDLVIHADIPNDPEVMQHRSGRTGRAGRKGVSIILVPPARKRRAEVLLNLAGIDTVWGTAPQPDEIRKLDQERMLKDALFSEETTPEDLALAQALLAERSAEDIAAALARLYRARLPSPEDILDPGQGSGRSREDRGREREGRPPRGDDRSTSPRPKKGKSSPRHAMVDGSVWFSASIGSRKNAEARWLLPMICRRGGIDKGDIGAIKIMDTTTEFEISERVAESFAVKIKRPDKEDNIRLEPLADAPQRQAASEERTHAPRRESGDSDHRERHGDRAREPNGFKPQGKPQGKPRGKPYEKPYGERTPKFDDAPSFAKKKKHKNKPGQAEPSVTSWSEKGAPGKKPKTKKKHRA